MQPVFRYLENTGIPIAQYLGEAGISAEMLEDSSSYLPLRMTFKFINLACSAAGIEDIGLEAGRKTSLQMIGDYGEILLATPTIHHYLKQGCRYISEASSGEHYWLAEEPEELRFCASVSSLEESDRVQNFLYIFLITINTIGHALDAPWQPSLVTIPGMTDETAARLASILPDTAIGQDGPYASMLIPYNLLPKPMTGGRSQKKQKRNASSDRNMPRDFLTSIAQLIQALIVSGSPTVELTAEAAGLSPRTLQRKLANYHTSFTELLAQTRMDMAKDRIRAGDCNLADLARQLGYRDAGNFSRAFYRVTGQLPKDFRARNKNPL